MFSTLLNEYETDSYINILKENLKPKYKRSRASKKYKGNFDEESKESFDEEFKGKSDEDEPEDIFDQKFKVYAVNYLSDKKICQLLDNIKIVCRRYWNKKFMLNN